MTAFAEGYPLFTKRDDDDVFSDKGKVCKGWNLRTAESVEELWKKTEAGIDLELFINGHPEHQNNWLKNLEDRVMGGTDGKSGASGCGLIGTSCNPMGGIGCEAQFEKYGTTFINKNSY
ncbi:hypothetical protein HYE68_003939 [Fusarium pseudograminearum]|nr:hypothetical protein HYE68_003939 [Fusarium pseudograminearum]